MNNSLLVELVCSRCQRKFDPHLVHTVCKSCGGTLFSTYDLERAKSDGVRALLRNRTPNMWRYRELLPVYNDTNIVTLGEGYTPILPLRHLTSVFKAKSIVLKDDGLIPTGTFKARGQSVAISKAKELGIERVVLASAGNAAGAMAAYCARGGVEAHVFLPKDAPEITKKECLSMNAHLKLVDGLIDDAGAIVTALAARNGWFNMSTLKEPYRVEGKKTMGYEIAEQSEWKLPDVIIYPTGGGTGLIGMWKAFKEMEEMTWISGKKPRMVSVQSRGCAPVVRAFQQGRESTEKFEGAATIAAGLRVPAPYASEQILRVIRESRGTAVAVSDESILVSMTRLGREGVFACPEGAATVAALDELFANRWIDKDENVLLYNTGTGLKYPELIQVPEIEVLKNEIISNTAQ
ncbi:MAG: threonine synthase [Thaumarchaeota archaeon]|nr:threonine synthase [Nitrososphaerota archaeon]